MSTPAIYFRSTKGVEGENVRLLVWRTCFARRVCSVCHSCGTTAGMYVPSFRFMPGVTTLSDILDDSLTFDDVEGLSSEETSHFVLIVVTVTRKRSSISIGTESHVRHALNRVHLHLASFSLRHNHHQPPPSSYQHAKAQGINHLLPILVIIIPSLS
jgi:hypothetical protein